MRKYILVVKVREASWVCGGADDHPMPIRHGSTCMNLNVMPVFCVSFSLFFTKFGQKNVLDIFPFIASGDFVS